MDKPLSSTGKVSLMCLPLHSAPDHIGTWTYFVPSGNLELSMTPWKRVGTNGILVKPALHGSKKENIRMPSSKRMQKDSLFSDQFYYAQLVKTSSKARSTTAIPTTQQKKKANKMCIVTNVAPRKLSAGKRMRSIVPDAVTGRFPDNPVLSTTISKDKFMSLLSLEPMRVFALAKTELHREGIQDFVIPRSPDGRNALRDSKDNRWYDYAGSEPSRDRESPTKVKMEEKLYSRDRECWLAEQVCKCVENSSSNSDAPGCSSSPSCKYCLSVKALEGSDLIRDMFRPESLCLPQIDKDKSSSGEDVRMEDGVSDELCIVSIRSLAPKDTSPLSTGEVSDVYHNLKLKPPRDGKLGRRLLLKPSPLDPSKQILYLDADYTFVKSNLTSCSRSQPSKSRRKSYSPCADLPKSRVKGRRDTGQEYASRIKLDKANRVKTLKGRAWLPCKRAPKKNGPAGPSGDISSLHGVQDVTPEPTIANKLDGQIIHYSDHSFDNRDLFIKRRSKNRRLTHQKVTEAASPPTESFDSGVPLEHGEIHSQVPSAPAECVSSGNVACVESVSSNKREGNTRISELRAMLRKKEADLEKVRTTMINFDDLTSE